MIHSSLLPIKAQWKSISFPSTLYLFPVLDLLLQNVPLQHHDDIRLGLQEALVNAAKHGNSLDVKKSVDVKFQKSGRSFTWVIADQGTGFAPPETCRWPLSEPQNIPERSQECGRGIFILYQIFDEVLWSKGGSELKLSKVLS